ncbi:MAG: hypothetical protein IJ242_16385 [Clostridia bacterium]|nr:hypothetical protein [Clostridia bacterium]
MSEEQKVAKQETAAGMKKTGTGIVLFYWFLALLAVAGLAFILLGFFSPHQTGTVISVGRISHNTVKSGMGIHAHRRIRYASDVKVKVRDSQETATVYYRVNDPSVIPSKGDEIQFTGSLVGNVPFPRTGMAMTGMFILALDGVITMCIFIIRRKQKKKTGT